MVLVVLDGRVGDLDAEAGEQLVQVVAVLLLLGLAEDDRGRRRRSTKRVDGVDLVGVEAGGAGAGGGLPLRVGGVGEDEDVGVGEGGGVEGAGAVGGDGEVALGERGGGAGERGVGGVGGLHLAGASGSIVQASEWASSKRTRASWGGWAWIEVTDG